MITEKDWKKIEKKAVSLYSGFELQLIEEIAERIANVGYANTVAFNNLRILEEMGIMYQNIISLIAEYNNMAESEIYEIFKDAELNSIYRDEQIYRTMGYNPLGMSDQMMSIVEASSRRTNFNISRLTGTTANSSQTTFLNAINKAYLEVSSGVKSYSQSMVDVIREVGIKGAEIVYPSGIKRSLESVVRTNIITSVNQTSAELQLMKAEEIGIEMFEVSAHSGARPSHAEWQGKVYTKEQLTTICGYGEVTGLCGANCRHTFFPYYKGSSKVYSNKELKELNNEKVKYNGKEISLYEAEQEQRYLERKIRTNKKLISAYNSFVNVNQDELIKEKLRREKTKLRLNNDELNNFLNETGLYKDNNRLKV